VLGAVKHEFGKFGEVLARVKRQLETAGRTIDETGVRTRAMERKLRQVEELPGEQAELVLGLPADALPAGSHGLEELDLELDEEDGVTA
jgi:DNA recombination protein RmuC